MNKYIKFILIALIFITFFFFPAIPSTTVYQTASQKKENEQFCMLHGCGLSASYTPYKYVKSSLYNIFVRKPLDPSILQKGDRPEIQE